MSGANWDIWHGSLFTATKAPTDGITLAALCSAWAAGTEDIIQNFHFYPFEYPFVPTVLGIGGTEPSHVWYGARPIVGPCQICF